MKVSKSSFDHYYIVLINKNIVLDYLLDCMYVVTTHTATSFINKLDDSI